MVLIDGRKKIRHFVTNCWSEDGGFGTKTPSCGERYHFPTSFHVLAIGIYRGRKDQYSKVKPKGATFASKFFSCAGKLG
jgi:hypothetical protein